MAQASALGYDQAKETRAVAEFPAMLSQPGSRRFLLLDRRHSPPSEVEAVMHRACPSKYLDFAESTWQVERARLESDATLAGVDAPGHTHWDWRNKRDRIDDGHFVLVAIECDADCQGLMAVDALPRPSKLGTGSILYLDYVESAPWNLKSSAAAPRYGGVGTSLLAEAVRMSWEEQLSGRIGLHSLPQAESFYARLGMTRWGPDPGYYDLTYWEFPDGCEFLLRVQEDMR